MKRILKHGWTLDLMNSTNKIIANPLSPLKHKTINCCFKPLLITTFFMLCFVVLSYSQEMKLPSFGKISTEELAELKCPIDTGAQAYYIFDKGATEFVYLNTTIRSDDAGSSKGFQMKFQRHVRIKILDKAASDLGNFEIPLYEKGANKEQLIGLKGFTYNLINGKIEKVKLDSKQINSDKKDDNWVVVKFAMPEVRAGSVIEVSYQILSDFTFNLQEWQFQTMYPVLYSEYTVAIPQYYFYNPDLLGYIRVGHTKKTASRSITFNYIEKNDRMVGGNDKYTFKEDYRDNIIKYYANDVPAFKAEKFLRTSRNYISKVTYELTGTQFPRSTYKNISSTWDDVSKELMKHENFGELLSRTGFLKEEIEAVKERNLAPLEQVSFIFERVKQRMNWNGSNRLLASGNLKQAWDKGSGSSADINLTLITFLKGAGLEAYPVALSTRANGIIPVSHPSLSGFNYVVAMAVVDGKRILLDATEPFAGVNQLPERCLNDNGRIIDVAKSDWVNLSQNATSYQMIFGNFKLDAEGRFDGSVEFVENGYAAWDRRNLFKKHNDDEAFKEAVEKEYNGLEISEFTITGVDSIYNQLKGVYQVSIEDKTDQMGDMMVFNPLLVFSDNENPFKLENREYPVEFPYPSRRRVIISYALPAEYKVESLPAPTRMVAEDKSFQFTFNASQVNNVVQIVHDFSLNKMLFLPQDYETIKKLFAAVVNKHNEKIVLKRIDN